MRDLNLDRLSAIIEDIYASTLDRGSWNGVLSQICRIVNTESGAVFMPASSRNPVHYIARRNFNSEYLLKYHQYFQGGGIWIAEAARHGRMMAESVALGEQLIDRASLLRSECFNDHLKPWDKGRLCGAVIEDGATGARPLMLGLLRSIEDPPFSAADAAMLALLQPHMRRAAQLAGRLAHAGRADLDFWWSEAVNALDWAVFAVAVSGRVLSANAAAERLLAEPDGIVVCRGRLTVVAPGPSRRLERAIHACCPPAVRGAPGPAIGADIVVDRPSGRRPYLLTVVPLAPREPMPCATTPIAVVHVADPQGAPPQLAARLARLFGLTDAEAAVAAMLCDGLRPDEIMERRMVSMSTVRTQIRAVLEKTGTTRQSELVRLASRLPPARPVFP